MSHAPSGAQKRQERRAAETLDEVAPVITNRLEGIPVPAKGVWRGYVLVPAKGGTSNGWFLRLVELPVELVEQFAVTGRRCPTDAGCDQRQTQVAKVVEWLRDPELIREWL